MNGSGKVLGLLQDAREMVRDGWGSSNVDVPLEVASGRHCASISLIEAAAAEGLGAYDPTCLAAHVALLSAAGVSIPNNVDAMFEAVFQFNDAQLDRRSVVAAFDGAIANLQDGPTPNADAALEVMAACDHAGQVVARQIVAEHPELDEPELAKVAAAELFYAAQDTAKASALGVTYSRA